MPTEDNIQVTDWGLIDFEHAYARQCALVEKVAKGNSAGHIIFCSHPPVVTLGRKSDRSIDICDWTGKIVEVNRGGRATYHGPSQLVTYPIINLNHGRIRKMRDIRFFFTSLADAWAEVLKDQLGLDAIPKYYEKLNEHDLTGVWIKNSSGQPMRKTLSIGIGVKNWCTFHGSALNLFADPAAFTGISPCGFSADVMTSLEIELHRPPSEFEIENLKSVFCEQFEKRMFVD